MKWPWVLYFRMLSAGGMMMMSAIFIWPKYTAVSALVFVIYGLVELMFII